MSENSSESNTAPSASGTIQTQGSSESNTTIERRVIIYMIKAYLEKFLKGESTEGQKCGRDLFQLLPSLVFLSEMFPWSQEFSTGTAFYASNLHHFLAAKLIGGDERLQLIRSMNAFLPEARKIKHGKAIKQGLADANAPFDENAPFPEEGEPIDMADIEYLEEEITKMRKLGAFSNNQRSSTRPR